MLFLALVASSCGSVYGAHHGALPWPSDGYERLPTLWFGANESGPNDLATLELIGRHSLAVVSWGQGIRPHGSRDEEKAEATAAAAMRRYLDSVGNNSTVLGVYRQIQIALGLFNVSHDASLDPANKNFWLHQVGKFEQSPKRAGLP